MDPIITADDVIRAGACRDGVYEVIERLGSRFRPAMPLNEVLRCLKKSERIYAYAAAYGYGIYGIYGNCYGDGEGDGGGDGYYGDGGGDGNGGYGDGYGNADGYGNITGKGSCSGDGKGSGTGSYDGNGYGSKGYGSYYEG